MKISPPSAAALCSSVRMGAPVLVALVIAVISCSKAEPVATPLAATQTPAAETPVPAPPAFPFIFTGNFYVNGHPGPAGQPLFAEIGRAQAPLVLTDAGTYRNIILGPAFPEDQVGDIRFYLGTPDGARVEATETFNFYLVPQPTNITLDLNFPRLP